MVPLTPLENELLGLLSWDTYGIGEYFGAIRQSNPLLDDAAVFQLGRSILETWRERGWLEVPADQARRGGAGSLHEIFAKWDAAWTGATRSSRGLPEVSLSEQAFRDVEWLRGVV